MNYRAPFILVLIFATPSFAQPLLSAPRPCPNPTVKEIQIELHQDSAEIPSPLIKPKPIVPIGCERPFLIHGEVYSADSPQAQDASNLKYFMKSVPSATSILDQYQSNRQKSRISAYTGTFGGLIAFFAPAISRSFFAPASRESALTAIRYTGITLAASGVMYSFTLLRTNESLIPKAVENYNRQKKDDPIELRFTTGWKF
jgi:hypothetical protein